MDTCARLAVETLDETDPHLIIIDPAKASSCEWKMCGPALASWPWLTPTLAPDCCQLSNPEPISSITCEIVTHHQYCLILETVLEYSDACVLFYLQRVLA